ncbi:MAG: pilus assembly protein TadG-related protein [Planctomycetota bacterium]|jgi:hypothetical protein
MKTTVQSTDHQKRRGIAILWVTLLLLILIGFAGLMIDAGRMFMAAHQLHNTADAAALAGARYVPMVMDPEYMGDSAEQVAWTYAQLHTAANIPVHLDKVRYAIPSDLNPLDPLDPSLVDDIVIGRYINHSNLFFVDHDTPDSMLVFARRTGDPSQPKLPLLFGPIFGLNTVNMKRYAIAKVIDPYGAGIIALGTYPDVPGITFSGVGTDLPLTVLNGGSVHVNSFMEDGALSVNSKNIILDVERLISVGGLNQKFYDSMDAYPDAYEDADIQSGLGEDYVEPDPYASVPDAVYDTSVAPATISDTGTYSPGYYSGGLQVSSSSVTLLPGDYYLDSVGYQASMSMSGGTLTGDGVTLHIIGDAKNGIDVQGNTIIDISAPESGTYEGIAIFQARDPDGDGDALNNPVSDLNGTGSIDVDGAIYMPQNLLMIGGTGYFATTRAVADRFDISGTGEKVINYKGEPEIAPASYLVE